ncbi:MAG: PD40 domain-containing protein [Planctomycetes bacterium]|nr:PD40 domain-containing protein [Planctomycetota bacterium]
MPGYYRYPTSHDDTVVFISEDDLWAVSASGGVARRLTSGEGESTRPALSPDGRWIAFTSREEGPPEVFVMPAEGGQPRRVTYLGSPFTFVAGWTPAGEIVAASSGGHPLPGMVHLYAVPVAGGLPRRLPVGPAHAISYGPGGRAVIGRHTADPARWKRYRGGRCGDLWIDAAGDGEFRRLISLKGNLASPLWVGGRVYFISDHEGIGNLYSATPAGGDLRRHTHHEEYYARNASTDGRRVVYHCGADLYLFDPASGGEKRVAVDYHSPRVRANRRFASCRRFLTTFHPRKDGQALAIVSRARAFVFSNFEGPVTEIGAQGEEGARRRLARFLHDGRRVITVTDDGGEEFLEVHDLKSPGAAKTLAIRGPALGRPVSLLPSPVADEVAITNHRFELVHVDLKTRKTRVLDTSGFDRIAGLAWSPDGRWLAYGWADSLSTSIIRLCQVKNGRRLDVTRSEFRDYAPSFDPDGKYLYFLSARGFDPVYDTQYFDLGFPRSIRPCLATLQRALTSPFLPPPREPGAADAKGKENEAGKPPTGAATRQGKGKGKGKKKKAAVALLVVEAEGIADRVCVFPVPDGLYGQIGGVAGGKVVFTSFPVEGSLGMSWTDEAEESGGALECWTYEDKKRETLVKGITSFTLTPDGKTLVYNQGRDVRVIKAGEKPDDSRLGDGSGRKGGWIDLDRVRVPVEPAREWRQMYREAWRLQRDHFWVPNMSNVDWGLIYRRYLPLLPRVGTRSEFSDLMWEMQGELGTSHCYEFGGDYRPGPSYSQGTLVADFAWDRRAKGYRVEHVVKGDSWAENSSLARPGLPIAAGDLLTAVGGVRLTETFTPGEALLHRAGAEVEVTYQAKGRGAEKRCIVPVASSEYPARYREWVESNRRHVLRETKGRVGYLHIPDMGPRGYAEFHRAYLTESERDALIVDVRFNGGGHVSQLILEKLARKRVGYDLKRYGPPDPYPLHSVKGPLVGLTNENAGSDGDIFSHCFKLMRLGPLIGKRTWGGVIGIHPRHRLVDGSLTTQPEFSFWFHDVGYGVENYGTEPDLEVDIAPQDHAAGRDPQLDRAIAEASRLLRENPPPRPDFSGRPDLALPRLPGSSGTDGRAGAGRARRARAP